MATIADFGSDSVSEEYPYRSISRLAVASLALMVFATLGLLPSFEWMLAAALVGIILSLAAILRIRAYPAEFAGMGVAVAGLTLNSLVFFGGLAEHVYIYMTEVPPGYERAAFAEFEAPKPLPDVPTQVALDMNGKQIFLKGYVHPASGDGQLRRFVLVPDLGTCCFGGQPNSTSMIDVTLTGTQTIRYQMRKYKLAGKFEVDPYARPLEGFDKAVFYKLRAEQVR